VLEPKIILETRERRLRSRVIKEYLVKRRSLPVEDGTWEGVDVLSHLGLHCLRKSNVRGEDF